MRTPTLAFRPRRRTPELLQDEAAECGAACVAMIAGYWGRPLDMPAMRRRFSLSVHGATLAGLIDMAGALRLSGRPLQLSLEELPGLSLPCILHWGIDHFVVLERVDRGGVTLLDPAVGRRRLPMAEVSRGFTGIALELTPDEGFDDEAVAPGGDVRAWRWRALLGRVTGLKRSLAQVLVLGVAMQTLGLIAPFHLQWLTDHALATGDRDLILVLGIGFLSLAAMRVALGAVRSWMTTVLSTSLAFQWQGRAFGHLMRLPLDWFEKRHLGDIVSRFGSIETIQNTVTTQFVGSVIDGLLVAVTLVVMVLYSTALTAVAVGAVLLYALLRWAVFHGLRGATAETIRRAALQQTHFIESVRGVQAVRLFDRGEQRRAGWLGLLADEFNGRLRLARWSVGYETARGLIFGLERVAVVWLAALAVLDMRMTVGMLLAFLAYQDQFSDRVAALVDRLFEFRMLRLHGERLADILTTPVEETGTQDAVDLGVLPASIELRDVAFRYGDGEEEVLSGIDLRIEAGECVAVTGASGSGKTTLVKLLLGLLTPTRGEILVGGRPVRRLGLGAYRRIVGTVMQDDLLFAGSIEENISFFDPVHDPARVIDCAGRAALHDEIVALPMGYRTRVGDIGTGLSGGQRQRLLLARALYKQPRLLVLDEATSHLDVNAERRVNAAVEALGATRVVVAHRPETIAMADRVIVIDRGRVASDERR
ncbi:peptidase domain-containing ABC transporter [Mitsuaria sp. 7]|uniref:peptidase domain-containing ABC transporter n=1 Tax=Mitsuaria sp. 7 TaxID=1658665 RepID=UPI001E443FB4|nr:peptidase domain-containing ABC transporter [Mitsuaria sp. 7]